MSAIENLNNKDEFVAREIYDLMQAAYKVEAELLGVTRFPPVERTLGDITSAKTTFWGIRKDGHLCGAVELSFPKETVSIDSMVVHPRYFRQGIASKLLNHVLENARRKTVRVQTAVENLPAIALYLKHGFREERRWSEKDFNLIGLTT